MHGKYLHYGKYGKLCDHPFYTILLRWLVVPLDTAYATCIKKNTKEGVTMWSHFLRDLQQLTLYLKFLNYLLPFKLIVL